MGCPAPGDGARWDAEGSRIREDFNYTASDYVADMGFEACESKPDCLYRETYNWQKHFCETRLTPNLPPYTDKSPDCSKLSEAKICGNGCINEEEEYNQREKLCKARKKIIKKSVQDPDDPYFDSPDLGCDELKDLRICPTPQRDVTVGFLQFNKFTQGNNLFSDRRMKKHSNLYRWPISDFIDQL